MIVLIALMYKEFKYSKYLIYKPSLIYKDSIRWKLSNRLRNCLPLVSDTWKVILQVFKILSHLLFLSKSQDNLYENKDVKLNIFVHYRVKRPVVVTWAVPKFNRVSEVLIKQFSEIFWYNYQLMLIRMD